MSQITLDPKYIHFYVNEKKRTVACVIDHTDLALIDFVRANCRISVECDENYYHWAYSDKMLGPQLKMPNRFIGVATCSEDDEWDETFGRLLAYHRARAKFDNSFFKHAQTYISIVGAYLDEAVDKINAYADKVAVNEHSRADYIQEKLNG